MCKDKLTKEGLELLRHELEKELACSPKEYKKEIQQRLDKVKSRLL
jgi:hypothetical protein